MRRVGTLRDERAAKHLGHALLARGIPTQVDPPDEGVVVIWALRDEHIDEARELYQAFVDDPSRFEDEVAKGSALRRDALRDEERKRKLAEAHTKRVRTASGSGTPVVTYGLILIFVAVALLGGMGLESYSRPEAVLFLYYDYLELHGSMVQWPTGQRFDAVLDGQVWRLFTPSFMHGGFMHMFFNLMVAHWLCTQVERLKGSGYLVVLVLVLSAASNTGQYLLGLSLVPPGVDPFSPYFLGFSGVNYGLFGYVWMKMRQDPFSGFFVSESNVVLFLVFFAACWTGALGPIANTAHGVGLGLGVLWGWLSSKPALRGW